MSVSRLASLRPIVAAIALSLLAVRAPKSAGQTVSFDAAYTADLFANVRGGMERGGTYMDNLDVQLTVRTDSLWPEDGPTLYLYGLANQGGNLSERYVGDAQVVSNIEAPTSWRLFEAWIEQPLFRARLTLRGGLYDLNTEFDVIPAAGLLVNSSFGIGPDYAQTGFGGPSIFPVTSLALRARVRTGTRSYLQGAVLDAVPGDPDTPRGTSIILSAEQGALLAAEGGWRSGEAKVAAGGWGYTTDYPAFESTAPKEYTYGAYVLGQLPLGDRTIVFGRAGFADPSVRVHSFGAYTGGGLVVRGPFTGVSARRLGFGIASAHTGAPYRRSQRARGLAPAHAETTYELTYALPVGGHVELQADLQYVHRPGARTDLRDALVTGLRFTAWL